MAKIVLTYTISSKSQYREMFESNDFTFVEEIGQGTKITSKEGKFVGITQTTLDEIVTMIKKSEEYELERNLKLNQNPSNNRRLGEIISLLQEICDAVSKKD